MKKIIKATIFLGMLMGVLYIGSLTWWHIPVVMLKDIYIAMVSVYWLVGVTVIPWNIHFKALETLDIMNLVGYEMVEGMELNPPRPEDQKFVKRCASLSLNAAIVLHLVTAGGLSLLAFFHIWPLGYYAAVLSVCLSFLRPAEKLYRYFAERLKQIKERVEDEYSSARDRAARKKDRAGG